MKTGLVNVNATGIIEFNLTEIKLLNRLASYGWESWDMFSTHCTNRLSKTELKILQEDLRAATARILRAAEEAAKLEFKEF